MKTNFSIITFAHSKFYCRGVSHEKEVLGDFPLAPKSPPLKTANFIFVVTSPSVKIIVDLAIRKCEFVSNLLRHKVSKNVHQVFLSGHHMLWLCCHALSLHGHCLCLLHLWADFSCAIHKLKERSGEVLLLLTPLQTLSHWRFVPHLPCEISKADFRHSQ